MKFFRWEVDRITVNSCAEMKSTRLELLLLTTRIRRSKLRVNKRSRLIYFNASINASRTSGTRMIPLRPTLDFGTSLIIPE